MKTKGPYFWFKMQQLTSSQYLCVLHIATAGLQGAALGSDEEEIVLLIYVIIDVQHNKVSFKY